MFSWNKWQTGASDGVCVCNPDLHSRCLMSIFFNVSSTDNLNSLPLAEQERAFLEVPRSEVFLEVSFQKWQKARV